jgi:hypothetical protein
MFPYLIAAGFSMFFVLLWACSAAVLIVAVLKVREALEYLLTPLAAMAQADEEARRCLVGCVPPTILFIHTRRRTSR